MDQLVIPRVRKYFEFCNQIILFIISILAPGGTSNSPGAGSTGGGATTAAGGGATTAAAAGATTATESAESGEAEGTTPMFTG
jgi:hypothetical protein